MPDQRHRQLDRGAPVQPDVRHRTRQRERRKQHDLPAAGNGPRHFRELSQCAEKREDEDPFGIAQTGKAFRNEIVARQFVFRMREFEQMELQYFVKPGTEMEWYETWKAKRIAWHKALGLPEENYRFHDHIKLAHYANAACDIEFKFPMGFKELEGIHSRTDFDLKQHEEFSGKKLRYFDTETNESYIPYVVETSIGLTACSSPC